MAAGAFAGSKALQADALDFLGDTTTYAISLYVIGMALHVRATAALIKGLSLAAMGLWVFGSTAYQVLVLGVPSATVMGGVGLLALLANLASVVLLMRFKDGDANVRSVWLCSRNDAIGNVAVIGAAAGVYFTGTAWPDLIVAALMAGLFLWSATQIVRQAWGEMQHCAVPAQNTSHQTNALYLAWLIALTATLGALFIGEVMGRTPCVLCWYQRIAMFPLALIPIMRFGTTLFLWH